MKNLASESRANDRQTRVLMLEAMQISLRNGLVDNAKQIGAAAAKLNQRIKTKDYSKDDAYLAWERKSFKAAFEPQNKPVDNSIPLP